jgi:MFS family permease
MIPDDVVADAGTPACAGERWPTAGRAWSAVGLLMAAYFVSYIDRSMLSLLVEPIKHSLHISDTQVGLLQGAAFSIFFMLMTFPAGWCADRGNRMRLIAFGIACWSIMTALCGLCSNFTQFFLARMGVAAGEATLTPAGPSIISDNFPPDRRTLPLSLYQMGAGMGAGVSLIAGGFIAGLVSGHDTVTIPEIGAFAPWQIIFFVIGLPGLLLSLTLFLAREPRRRDQERTEGTLHELVQVFKSRRAYIIPHLSAYCLYQTYAYAYFGWLPAFFIRVHGWSVPEVGLKYGVVHLVSAMTGAVAGGWLARSLWHRGRRDANLLTCTLCSGAMVVPAVFGTIVPNVIAAVLLLGLTTALLQAIGGTNSAVIQEIAPNRLRGRFMAIYYVVTSLSSMTIGPLLIGVMNDHVFSGIRSVGKSMSLSALLTLPPASALLFIALRRRTNQLVN